MIRKQLYLLLAIVDVYKRQVLEPVLENARFVYESTPVGTAPGHSSEQNKQTLQVMITRNAFVVYGLRDETDDSDFLNTYDMFDLSGISGIMTVSYTHLVETAHGPHHKGQRHKQCLSAAHRSVADDGITVSVCAARAPPG